MRTDLDAVLHTSVEDELGKFFIPFCSFDIRFLRVLRGLKYAEERLYHMVPVSILSRD
jgi:hypothetical protein